MGQTSPSQCIEVKDGTHIAKCVLMPGDPLRAKFVAEHYLENPVLFNDVRGMYGYTGLYEGKEVSVMGSGMGNPDRFRRSHRRQCKGPRCTPRHDSNDQFRLL